MKYELQVSAKDDEYSLLELEIPDFYETKNWCDFCDAKEKTVRYKIQTLTKNLLMINKHPCLRRVSQSFLLESDIKKYQHIWPD